MNKSILSVASVAAVLLFVGAGCSEANLSDDTRINANTQNPIVQNTDDTKKNEQIQVNDDIPVSTTSSENEDKGSEVKINTNINSEVKTNLPTVKTDDSKKWDEEENENESDEDEGNPVSVTPSPAPAPTPKPVTPAPTTPPATTVKTYTMAEVKLANTKTKCWSVISGNVYDLTPFTPGHPGGQAAILGLCGKDGTAAFVAQHGGQARPENTLAKYYLGALKN